MSGSFVFAARPLPLVSAVTSNSAAKVVVDATLKSITVPTFEVNEIGGGTQNLTVEIYDGTTHTYLSDDAGTVWKAHAVTAYKGYKFTLAYPIPKGSKLQITSSAASGDFSIFGTQLPTV